MKSFSGCIQKEKAAAYQDSKQGDITKLDAIIRSVTAESEVRKHIVTKLQEVHDKEINEMQEMVTERDLAVERINELNIHIQTATASNKMLQLREESLIKTVSQLKVNDFVLFRHQSKVLKQSGGTFSTGVAYLQPRR